MSSCQPQNRTVFISNNVYRIQRLKFDPAQPKLPNQPPIAKYVRKQLICDCQPKKTIAVIKKINSCIPDSRKIRRSGNTLLNINPDTGVRDNIDSRYYTTRLELLKGRCQTYNQKLFNFTRIDQTNNKYAANCATTDGRTDCRITYYKPSNQKFAVQGAVSSSNQILSKKYDIIRNEVKPNKPFINNVKCKPTKISNRSFLC